MAFQARMYTDVETGTVSIRLVGDLDSGSAGRLNELIDRGVARAGAPAGAADGTAELPFLGRAALPGLRPPEARPGTDIVLVGTRPEVADTIRLTGLDHSVIMQDPADV